MSETLTTADPARTTVLTALDLADQVEDRSLILHIEDGTYFRPHRCEHPDCARPAAASLEYINLEDGVTEIMVCGDCAADAHQVIRMSEDTDGSEDITLRVSPYWLLYVHDVAA
ncbi:hypothetical protein [Nocardia farcinica]|uniref:hypothetical protein n=1 Tax=Nocardia farcinica TaxID=37329 RepID=UPI0024546C72|nr:hypothetical protein [Nocardia farcinica]